MKRCCSTARGLLGLMFVAACSTDAAVPVRQQSPALAQAAPLPGRVAWIGIGGGPHPHQNQISIEQDLMAASAAFGPRGLMLFAGGPGNQAVQVEMGTSAEPTLRLQLGSFFSPRAGRTGSYRPTQLAVHYSASRAGLSEALQRARGESSPLLVYVAGHGDMGASPNQNVLLLWGEDAFSVEDLAHLLDETPLQRPLQLVSTTCFSGGFAEVVFKGADVGAGPAPTPRCGLFAAPADLPAAGCDPNPDRRLQEGYGVYFFDALRGVDREGRTIPKSEVDFDGDGRVSLREAHAYVRIQSSSADVPTSTAERWLEHATPDTATRESAVSLPEEEAVITALSKRTGLAPDLATVQSALRALEDRIETAERNRDTHVQAEDAAYLQAAAELLHRWPVLDDPWHPAFEPTLREQGALIQRHLDESPTQRAFREATARTHQWENEYWALRLRAAPIERLARALEHVSRARRLAALGGEPWQRYREILACERGFPPENDQGSGSAQQRKPVE